MTISRYIVEFLELFEDIKIDTNHIKDGSDHYGLFKSPARDKLVNTDGSTTITEYYQFFAFQDSMSEDERLEDDEWLEKLTYWVDDYNVYYDYPEIDGNRMVTNIAVTGAPTPFIDSDNGITYQISLSITYEREGN